MPYARNNDVSIYYETIGRGAPLVMYHGLGDSGRGWYELGYVDALTKSRQLVLMDGRGHGRSSKPAEPSQYAVEHCVQDVLAVADDLGLRFFDYLGCSMGGWVGYGLARYAPQRLSALIINGAHAFAQSLAPLRGLLAGDLDGWISFIHYHAGLTTAQVQQLYGNDLHALQALVANDRPDLSSSLFSLECPCLFMAGSEDPLAPLVKRTAERVPYSEYIELKGLNHFSAITRSSQALAAIDRFLCPSMTLALQAT
ncbi:MAG: hypothetical protein CMK89_12040 [Pseudomonadales bacterium]|nr:hypothetical protein [Pseudomonadales bacterium]